MTDVLDLRVARAPQRQPALPEAVVWVVPPGGRSELLVGPTPNPDAQELASRAQEFIRKGQLVEPSTPLPAPVRDLDGWLLAQANAPALADLDQELIALAAALLGAAPAGGEAAAQGLVADTRWTETRRRVGDSLIAASVLASVPVPTRTDLVRLVLVMGLVEYVAVHHAALAAAADPPQLILSLLQDRTPLLPCPPFPLPILSAVARKPGFDDHYVVREEWSCYVPGEIAHIENVLKGELKERVHKQTTETETTLTTETETKQIQERDTQTTDRFELSDEASKQTQMRIGVEGHVDVSGQAGPMKIATHVGATFEYSQSEATRHATQVAREAVTKAVTRIEQTVREARTVRTLTRVEDTDTHTLDATTASEHVVGIYRWVDKIQRLQMFRYPHRYLLEFQVPEPGAYLRWLELRGRDRGFATPEPIPFTDNGKPPRPGGGVPPIPPPHTQPMFGKPLAPTDLTENNYLEIAGRYHTLDVSPYPPATLVARGSLLKPPPSDPTQDKTPVELWETPTTGDGGAAAAGGAPTGQAVTVPDGYEAKEWRGCVLTRDLLSTQHTTAAPGWLKDKEPWDVLPPSLFMTLGDNPARGENGLVAGDSVPGHGHNVPVVTYFRADITGAKMGVLPIRVMAENYDLASVFVEVTCARTETAVQKWQFDTFAKIQAAYFELKRQHEEEKAQRQIRAGIQIDGASPTENAQRARQELKRLVIELLLDESFTGRPAIDNNPSDPQTDPNKWPTTNITKAVEVAPIVQFLEQVFEWENITYVLYPYYWADAREWPELLSISSADPDYADFLRAGSARVVVPARVGYAPQVTAFITTLQPWGAGPAPIPGDPLYISVAQEIRGQKHAPDGGEPLDSWEVKLPTTLVWLDSDSGLPKVNKQIRLTAPQVSLCPSPAPATGPDH